MKKILAFVLAFTIAFSATGYSYGYGAARISPEVEALVDIGMLVGDGKGVTEEYTQKEMDRLTAAISILKLRGLYEKALNYEGSRNFADSNEVKWPEGRNILAYLKDNPDLGFIGDDRGRFRPYEKINEQAYFKVLLETLGYKQIVSGKGDFTWEDTFKFASSIGLKASREDVFTIELLAKATVAALRTKAKAGVRYINILIDEGVIRKPRAIAAGLISDMIDADVKSVKAVGNTVVEIVFEEDVDDYDVDDLDNYEIDGLTVKDAYLVRKDAVRVLTSAQSSGKLYYMTVGDQRVKFTGVAKVSGAPRIKNVKSEDVETVVIEFDKELDFETATDISNYSISGVDVEEAVLEGKKVTLSTDGLQARKSYMVKVTNIKSIDGTLLRSASKNFYTRLDTTPPTLRDVKAETNQRVVIKFSEAVTRDSAENLMNYYIKSSSGELEIWDAELTGEDEDTVELTTAPMKSGTKYELTVENIVDKTKAANMMKKPAKKTFLGMREDKSPPQLVKSELKVLSRNYIQVVFSDSSRLIEDTVLDPDNYEVTQNNKYKDSIIVESVEKISYKDGKYKVMLRVEDLTINTSYTVTAYNIEDEFGNVLEKNNSGTVTASRDDFAAATVNKYKVVSGNKLEIFFTKPLDEESAEDISNYEINNDIGAPIEATYEDGKVTLETAYMIEGKIYKITIDGVLDMMGNELRLSFEFRARAGEDDHDGPRLDYIYPVNKYVVAVVFDEPVTYTENSTVLVLKGGGKTIKLYAKALTDDDSTIEFSNVEEGKKLSEGVLYTIDKGESLKGIKDRTVNKNPFDRSDLDDYDWEIYGIDEDPEKPEILYITQRDGKTFEMEMSKEVVVKKKEVSTIGSPSATFSVKTDAENPRIVTFTITSSKSIDGDKDYKIDIEKIVTDRHGIGAENTHDNYTLLYGEYKDEDKPYIVSVTAIDRVTVEIEYSENIGYEGRYTIKNTDDTAKYKTIGNSLKKIDKNKVILSLSQPLEGRYEYILIIESQAKDLVGNTSEELKGDEFYFMGTDLAPVKLPDIEEEEDKIAAEKVMDKIDDLPKDIKLSHKEQVYDVLEAYNDLTANQKKYVTNYDKLKKAVDEIARLEQEVQDKRKAAAVEKMIDELPKVENIKLEDEKEVKEAREAYDALTKAQKNLVPNLRKLVQAEEKIKELKEKQQQSEEDKRKAARVEEIIDDLPKIEDIRLRHKEAVENARAAYESLTSKQKELVKNLDKLKKAENRISELEKEKEQEEEDKRKASRVEYMINELPDPDDIRLRHKDQVEAARNAYDNLTEAQKKLVTNIRKLIMAENKIAELEAKSNEEEKAEKEAREAAEKAVAAYEVIAGHEEWNKKISALAKAIETLKGVINEYLTGEANLERAFAAVDKALEDAEAFVQRAKAVEGKASEAYQKLKDGDFKTALAARIRAAKAKADEAIGRIEALKGNIPNLQDVQDVKAAKTWLTADKFAFGSRYPANSESPRILPLAKHENQTVFKYIEIGRMENGKFVKYEGGRVRGSAFVEIEKDSGALRIYRGRNDASMIVKVEISKGKVVTYKYFKINIPEESRRNRQPVTIEAL